MLNSELFGWISKQSLSSEYEKILPQTRGKIRPISVATAFLRIAFVLLTFVLLFGYFSDYAMSWMLWGLNPLREKLLVSFYKTPRPLLCPTQVPIQLVTVLFPGGEVVGA